MGIISDKTRASYHTAATILAAGLDATGEPGAAMAASIIRAYADKALELGYEKLGMTDEVTVQADGEVTGTIS